MIISFNMIIQCPFPGCNYEADNDDAQIIVALLNIHAQTHATASTRPTAPQPKLDRPRVDMGSMRRYGTALSADGMHSG